MTGEALYLSHRAALAVEAKRPHSAMTLPPRRWRDLKGWQRRVWNQTAALQRQEETDGQ